MNRTFSMMLAAIAIGGSLSACNSPGERAVGGALIGGGSGALVGGALDGRRGALLGAGVGAVGGAVIGAASAPQPAYGYPQNVYGEPAPAYRRTRGCPYGAYQDEYGNVYCN
jgi:hypothetical protein